MKKTNVSTKNTELSSVLQTHFKGKINLARVKLIAYFITALCKVQTVTFEKLANAFDTTASSDSSLRRIQRFIATFSLNNDLIARLVFNLLPKQDKFRLTIDRTKGSLGKRTSIYLCWSLFTRVCLSPAVQYACQKGQLQYTGTDRADQPFH